MKSWGEQNKRWNLFVSRFFECPFCFEDDKKREDEVAECMNAYSEHYEFAFCRFHRYGAFPLRQACCRLSTHSRSICSIIT